MTDANKNGDVLGLQGKLSIVLGAGQGIGRAVSLRLAENGASVALVDVDAERAEAVASEIRQMGVRALPITCNLLDPAASANALREARDGLGLPTVLVSIVGQALMKPALDISEEDWDYEFSRNLRYFFFAAQAYARMLIEANEAGSIVVVGSVDGMHGSPVHAPYGAAKAGLSNLVKSLAVEWADHGIRVNCIAGGSIITPRIPETDASRAIMHDSLVPMRRSAQPDEIATALLFMSSSLASYITGQTLAADGGWTAANIFNLARKPGNARMTLKPKGE